MQTQNLQRVMVDEEIMCNSQMAVDFAIQLNSQQTSPLVTSLSVWFGENIGVYLHDGNINKLPSGSNIQFFSLQGQLTPRNRLQQEIYFMWIPFVQTPTPIPTPNDLKVYIATDTKPAAYVPKNASSIQATKLVFEASYNADQRLAFLDVSLEGSASSSDFREVWLRTATGKRVTDKVTFLNGVAHLTCQNGPFVIRAGETVELYIECAVSATAQVPATFRLGVKDPSDIGLLNPAQTVLLVGGNIFGNVMTISNYTVTDMVFSEILHGIVRDAPVGQRSEIARFSLENRGQNGKSVNWKRLVLKLANPTALDIANGSNTLKPDLTTTLDNIEAKIDGQNILADVSINRDRIELAFGDYIIPRGKKITISITAFVLDTRGNEAMTFYIEDATDFVAYEEGVGVGAPLIDNEDIDSDGIINDPAEGLQYTQMGVYNLLP